MAKKQNANQPGKPRIVRINLSWLYILLLGGIIWMLWGSRGVPPAKVE